MLSPLPCRKSPATRARALEALRSRVIEPTGLLASAFYFRPMESLDRLAAGVSANGGGDDDVPLAANHSSCRGFRARSWTAGRGEGQFQLLA
jgi:hypothetical protein